MYSFAGAGLINFYLTVTVISPPFLEPLIQDESRLVELGSLVFLENIRDVLLATCFAEIANVALM